MNLPETITDNITELLVKIIEFTHIRQKVLTQNINNIHLAGFEPRDLAVDEFSNILNIAITEHSRNNRIVLFDTESIKFGVSGKIEAKPVIDECSKSLLEKNQDEYLESQVKKLLENSLNQRIAADLLKQKQTSACLFE